MCLGTRMPDWVTQGFDIYQRRLGHDCRLVLKEIASPRKSKSQNPVRVMEQEGELLLAAVPADAYLVALDERGKMQDSKELSVKLSNWFGSYRRVAILVGGADGLSQNCLARCQETWSLSKMTFPHPLVRVIVAEQIYRAYSLLNNHPYHRV